MKKANTRAKANAAAAAAARARLPRAPLSRRTKIIVAVVACLLAVALLFGLLFLLFPTRPAVFRYGGTAIDEEMYSFWFSVLKKDYMVRYNISGTSDTEAFWQSEVTPGGGITQGEQLTATIDDAIRAKVVRAALYDATGRTLTDIQRRQVEDYYSEVVELTADGDEKAFAALCERYGTTPAAIRRCALFDIKGEYLRTLLAATDGSGLTVTQKDAYYHAHYVRFKVLYLNPEEIQEVDSYGNPVTRKLTAEEKTALAAVDTALQGKLTEGIPAAEFDTLLREHSCHPLHRFYPNGIYQSDDHPIDLNETLEEEVAKAAEGITPGKLLRIENEKGVRYLLGYALDLGAYNDTDNKRFFDENANDGISDFLYYAAESVLTEQVGAALSEVQTLTENKPAAPIVTIPYNADIKSFYFTES